MHIRCILLTLFMHLALGLPFTSAQDMKTHIGKWVGHADLAKKHYKELAKKHFKEDAEKESPPNYPDAMKSITIEFKADNSYVLSNSKAKRKFTNSYEILSDPKPKKNEFSVRVQRGGPPPQIWNCKLVQIGKREVLLMNTKSKYLEMLLMVRAETKADK